jgi:poly(A) polymerase
MEFLQLLHSILADLFLAFKRHGQERVGQDAAADHPAVHPRESFSKHAKDCNIRYIAVIDELMTAVFTAECKGFQVDSPRVELLTQAGMDDNFFQRKGVKLRQERQDLAGVFVSEPCFNGEFHLEPGYDLFQQRNDHLRIGEESGAPFFLGHHGYRTTQIPVDMGIPEILESVGHSEEVLSIGVEQLRDNRQDGVVFREDVGKPFFLKPGMPLWVDEWGNSSVEPSKMMVKNGAEQCIGHTLERSQVKEGPLGPIICRRCRHLPGPSFAGRGIHNHDLVLLYDEVWREWLKRNEVYSTRMKKESVCDEGAFSIRNHLHNYPQQLISVFSRAESRCGGFYLAGGTVRDWLLGRVSADLDFVVPSGALSCCRVLLSELGGGALIPLGDPEDDTARVVWNRLTIDISGFRGGALNIEDDLCRRDFTINAMAIRFADLVDEGTELILIDPTGGRRDLEEGVLRTCDHAFLDDPLRILRGYRLSAILGFAINASTQADMDACAPLIVNAAAERISHELDLIMGSEKAFATITAMAASTILWLILPELHCGLGVKQPGYHHLDVFYHSLAALGHMEEILRQPESYYPEHGALFSDYIEENGIKNRLKWSALLHDLGKPAARDVHPDQEGRITFYNHDRIGRDVFLRFAERLKWSNKDRDMVGSLIELHMYPFHLCNVRRKSGISNRACLKIWKKAGDYLPGLFLLAMADSLAGQGEKKPEGMEEELAGLFGDLQQTIDRAIRPVFSGPRLVTGTDLITRFNLLPGPVFSTIFAKLELAMVEGHVHNRKEALDWVAQYLQNEGIREDRP